MPRGVSIGLKDSPERDAAAREVGASIRRWRKARGLSQHALARAVGRTQRMISVYEQGMIPMKFEVLWEIAHVLEVDLRELIPPQPPRRSSVIRINR